MKIRLVLLLVLGFLVGCTGKKEEFYSNSKLKKRYFLKEGKLNGKYLEFFESGNLKEKHSFSLGIKVDTSYFYFDDDLNGISIKIDNKVKHVKPAFFYFPTGELKAKGFLDSDNVKVDKWTVFHKNSNLNKLIEYFNIDGREYVNQTWKYNDKGKINKKEGHFFDIQISKDTLQIDEEVKVLFNLSRPLFSPKSEVYVLIPVEDSDLKKDFSNFREIEKDTFLSLNREGRSSDYDKYNLSVAFSLSYEKTGVKQIRGVLVERTYDGSIIKNDSLKFEERYLYFNKSLFVR